MASTQVTDGDVCKYTLHLDPTLIKDESSQIATDILTFVHSASPSYIWHRESFNLRLLTNVVGNQGRLALQGETQFGDCVDDEWYIVWLLREITRQWAGSVAR